MRFSLFLLAALTGAVMTAVGCGGGSDSSSVNTNSSDGGLSFGDATAFTFGEAGLGADASPSGRSDAHGLFVISPSALQTVTVAAGTQTGAVIYSATLNGAAVSAAWSIDRGDLASITAGPAPTATLMPSGTTGGVVTVTAGFDGQVATAQVLIKLTAQQNGPNASSPAEQAQLPTDVSQLTAGGGVGGVGGEGIGGAVSDPGTLTALQNPGGDAGAQGLSFLYPYDKTVWPRAMLAPLLMWSFAPGDADAIQIALTTTSGSFSWTGTFGKPAILQTDAGTAGAFIRHPIPQDIWDMATNTAGGTVNGQADQLTVALTVAKDGVGYGPIVETWPVAPGRLPGIIYYNSYGTQLAKNNGGDVGGAVGGDGKFGGAVLSIHVGDTAPKLVAGANGDKSGCRVCHSVAAGGSTLVVQHGDNYGTSSAYDLMPTGATEHVLATGATFPAMYPDGTFALSPSGQILPLPDDTTLPTVQGLSPVATSLGTPAFSPDGKRIVFNPFAGPGVVAPGQELMVMAFDGTSTFSAPTVVANDKAQPYPAVRPGWPAFFPDGQSLVFHHQSNAGDENTTDVSLYTREGALAQIAWTNVTDATHVTPLDNLNGKGYLPKLPQAISMTCSADGNAVGGINADHGDDVDLNYEPTVNPRPSGGYVWVVFTSRRMYGNEATIPPFCSDPRGVDLIKNVTTKKLWVAAVDLGAAPGTDASHPGFYLPAQELLAGNSRAFWVLDPCRADGQTCQSGDQCCNGFCEAAGDGGGALICKNAPPNNTCSNLNDKCVTASDCCDPTDLCINGFCTQPGPPPPPK